MHIPVHAPWLPGYIDVTQTVVVIRTMLGFFWTDLVCVGVCMSACRMCECVTVCGSVYECLWLCVYECVRVWVHSEGAAALLWQPVEEHRELRLTPHPRPAPSGAAACALTPLKVRPGSSRTRLVLPSDSGFPRPFRDGLSGRT